MKKKKLNLQMFGEGAGPASGSDGGAFEGAEMQGENADLSDVVYGKSTGEATNPTGDDTNSKISKSQAFEDLIKGEYKDEFTKRTQKMIDKRFAKSKQMEEQLASHMNIMNMLADKYGADANDVDSLMRAIESDESFYEQEALEKGLTVEQLKEVKALQRENENFRRAEEEARIRENSERIYAEWTEQAEAMAAKYGLENFSLEDEVQNPEFTSLLSKGISVETAYKAIHMDDMIGGAMAKTADAVRSKMANSIASRQSRPSENGVANQNSSQIFKTDVNSLSRKDREEIEKRVMRGAIISF